MVELMLGALIAFVVVGALVGALHPLAAVVILLGLIAVGVISKGNTTL